MTRYVDWSDGRLKCQIFERLAYGVLPFEQWMPVFYNSKLVDWPGLRCKAFTVWFPTTIDYLRGVQKRKDFEQEAQSRAIDLLKLPHLAGALETCFSDCLALYSRDEQIFLRDRRLQNVHGMLHLYVMEKQKIPFFDASTRSIAHSEVLAADYRAIMKAFGPDIHAKTLRLLNRLSASEQFAKLLNLYLNELDFATKLWPLAEELGVTGGDRGAAEDASVEGAA